MWTKDGFYDTWHNDDWRIYKRGSRWILSGRHGSDTNRQETSFHSLRAAQQAGDQHIAEKRNAVLKKMAERDAKRSQAAHKAWATRRGKPQPIFKAIFQPGELDTILKPKTRQEKIDDISDEDLMEAAREADIEADAVSLRLFISNVIEGCEEK